METEDIECFIITSNRKDEEYWNGVRFCKDIAQLYYSAQAVIDVLQQYWFNNFCEYDTRQVTVKPLTEYRLKCLQYKENFNVHK